MSALSDIQREIDRVLRLAEAEAGQKLPPAALRFARSQRMQVLVGQSAKQGIIAETGDGVLPETIDDVPLKEVHDFAGFEVVVL